MVNTLRPPIPYYGGKTRMAKWIAQRIPMCHGYIEPYAGLASVLLARLPAKTEILNDASEVVVTWWRVVRTQTDSLVYLLERTPWSRIERNRARHICLHPCEYGDVEVAWAFHVCTAQSLANNIVAKNAWRHQFRDSPKRIINGLDTIYLIAERIRFVQLECVDATVLLKRVQKYRDLSIYVDPPYRHAVTTPYLVDTVDHDVLVDLLLQQKGRVAVSGYPADFGELSLNNWWVDVKETREIASGSNPRLECLWTNYRTPTSKQKQLL